MAAAAQLARFLLCPVSSLPSIALQRRMPVSGSDPLLHKMVVNPWLLRIGVRDSIRVQCACAKREANNLSRFESESSARAGSTDELKRQLQEVLYEVKMLMKAGNTDGAIDLLEANYESVREEIDRGYKSIEQAAVVDVLAMGFMLTGNFQSVLNLLEMLKEMVHNLADDMPLLDSILLHMGSMYMHLEMFAEAKPVFERSLKILEAEFGSNSPYLIAPLMGIAKVFGGIGRSVKSIAVYERAVGILEMHRGKESEELVVPLSGLGNLLINERKVKDAELCFSRILSIYTNAYGENDGRVGMAMCALAHSKRAKGSAEEAIDLYKRGLHIIKETDYMTIDDYILERMMVDLAELLHIAGREREGRSLLEECLQLCEKSKGLEHPSTIAHLLNLATSYTRSKNFVEAERLLRTCFSILLRTVSPEDVSITLPMLQLAVTLFHLKQDEEAESLVLEVVRIREQAFGKDSLPVGEALDCLVSIQNRLGKGDGELLEMLQRILAIQEKELGHESEEVITTLKKVVYYLDKMGKRDEKMPLQRRLSFLRKKQKETVQF